MSETEISALHTVQHMDRRVMVSTTTLINSAEVTVTADQKGSGFSAWYPVPIYTASNEWRIDMNRFLSALLFSSGVLVFSVAANAQTRGQGPYYPQRDDPYYRNDPNRGSYPDQGRYRNDRYGYGRTGDPLIGRVLADLNMAASNARVDGHERRH